MCMHIANIIAITVFTFGLHTILSNISSSLCDSYGCPCMSLQILHSTNIMLPVSLSYVVVMYIVNCGVWWCNLIHEWIKKKEHKLEWLKNKIFKQGIGITEKSQKTRRDHWGGNVNHKSLFWLHYRSLKELWFTLPPQQSLLVSWLFFFSDPYSLFKIFIFNHSSRY